MLTLSVQVTLFFFIILSIIMLNRQHKQRETIGDWYNNRNTPDIENCQQYYNKLGILMSCPHDQRFDIVNTHDCRHYYLTNCKNRYNASFISCENIYNMLPTIEPFHNCNQYIDCSNNHLYTCPPQHNYDIELQKCLPKELVECGSRE